MGEFYYQRGMNEMGEKEYERAEQDMRRSLALDPTLGGPYAVLGAIRKVRPAPGRTEPDRDAMVGFWERALDRDPDLTGVYEQLGNLCMSEGNYDQARQLYGRGLERDPSAATLLRRIGAACAMLGREQDAIVWFSKAVRYDQTDPQALDGLGQSYHAAGDLKRARVALERSVALKESDQNVLHLGLVEAESGRMERAVRLLRRSLQLEPDNAEAAFYLGELLRETGSNQAEALELWRRAAQGGYPPAQDSLRALGKPN